MNHRFNTIGIVHSPFKEKFGIPRQPGLIPEACGVLELLPPYDRWEALAGLENFSHIWVIFVFHRSLKQDWKSTVRPPRLGGNQRLGVFATRSTYRPNPIGQSVVEFKGVSERDGKPFLRLGGIDLLDGTPVLDIKPYVPYADAISRAQGGFAQNTPEAVLKVEFTPEATIACSRYASETTPDLKKLIIRILQYDPRPAYRQKRSDDHNRIFGMRFFNFDLKWRVTRDSLLVLALDDISSKTG